MSIRKLRLQRTAVLTFFGFAAIVAGLWVIAALLFGTGIGLGAGLAASGVALLVLEGLSTA